MISFYFSSNYFISRNIKKIKQRFQRLLIPYIIWPFIFFIMNNSINIINSKKFIVIDLKYFYYQILIGNGIYLIFWFQFNLIFISILFAIIIFISKNNYICYLIFFGLLCFIFISSPFYRIFFAKYNEIASFSIKPLPETFIFSLIGLFFFSIDIINKINKYCDEIYNNKKKFIIILILLFYFSKENNDFHLYYPYFYYFSKILLCSLLFIIFLTIPFDKIKNDIYIKIINIITNYTGGIYYLHPKIQSLLELFFEKMKSRTFLICIILYLLCYLICFYGVKILKKSILRNLFI